MTFPEPQTLQLCVILEGDWNNFDKSIKVATVKKSVVQNQSQKIRNCHLHADNLFIGLLAHLELIVHRQNNLWHREQAVWHAVRINRYQDTHPVSEGMFNERPLVGQVSMNNKEFNPLTLTKKHTVAFICKTWRLSYSIFSSLVFPIPLWGTEVIENGL